MTLQSKYASLIKNAILFARDESEMPHAAERSRNYLMDRVASFHDLLHRRDEIGTEHLKSAYNLVSNFCEAYDDIYNREDRSLALHKALLRDLRDELDAAIGK